MENLLFFDLVRMPDEQIKGTPILKIVLLTLKYIRSKEIVTKIDTILELFKEIKGDQEQKEYVELFTYYVEHASKKEVKKMLVDKMRQFFKDTEWEKSTVVREIEERGEEKGEVRGEERGLKRGLKRGRVEGIDIGAKAAKLILTTKKADEEIAKITGLSVEEIRILREKLNGLD